MTGSRFSQLTNDGTAAGIFWMVLTGLLFVGVLVPVKVMGDAVPAAQAAFLRYVLGLPFLIPMIGVLRRAKIRRQSLVLFAWRGVFHTLAVTFWFYAMTRIPMAEVTAMGYLTPVFLTIAAVLLLGDAFSGRRALAIMSALLGAAIILRPGFRDLEAGHGAMVLVVLLFTGSYLIAKKLSDEFSAITVVAMLSLTVTIGLAPLAALNWVPVSPRDLGLLFLVACFATAGHYTMTRAFAAAPVSVTQPMTFLQLVWSTAIGALFFEEAIDLWVVMGGVVIVGAVTLLSVWETRRKEQTIQNQGESGSTEGPAAAGPLVKRTTLGK